MGRLPALRGVESGDRVVVLAGRDRSWRSALLGVLEAGGVAVPCQRRYRPRAAAIATDMGAAAFRVGSCATDLVESDGIPCSRRTNRTRRVRRRGSGTWRCRATSRSSSTEPSRLTPRSSRRPSRRAVARARRGGESGRRQLPTARSSRSCGCSRRGAPVRRSSPWSSRPTRSGSSSSCTGSSLPSCGSPTMSTVRWLLWRRPSPRGRISGRSVRHLRASREQTLQPRSATCSVSGSLWLLRARWPGWRKRSGAVVDERAAAEAEAPHKEERLEDERREES